MQNSARQEAAVFFSRQELTFSNTPNFLKLWHRVYSSRAAVSEMIETLKVGADISTLRTAVSLCNVSIHTSKKSV